MNKRILSLLPCLAATFSYAQTNKPNVIIILIDDMGIGDVDAFGTSPTPTPNISKLAQQGLQINHFYSAAPVSSPARAGLLTGLCPIKYKINTFLDTRKANANREMADYLPGNAPTMAHAFQNAGYATGHFGKWHMGGGRDVKDAPGIKNYGFDEYNSTWESPDPDPIITSSNWIWADTDSVKRWNRTAYFIDRAVAFMKRCKSDNKPFFLNLWPDDVHTPWVPESKAGKNGEWEKRGSFIPVMQELDKQIGRLMQILEDEGLAENTIVVFTADNGPAPSFNQERTLGKRGLKNSLYEGGINMPFIIRYPKKIKPGKTNDKTVLSTLDLYPSLCAMAGIPVQEGYKGDGADYSKVLLGKKETDRKEVLMWDFGRNSLYNHPANPYHVSPHLAIRKGKWKLLCGDNATNCQLFDINADPNETNDVAAKHPELVKELSAQVCKWYETYRFGM